MCVSREGGNDISYKVNRLRALSNKTKNRKIGMQREDLKLMLPQCTCVIVIIDRCLATKFFFLGKLPAT